MIYKMGVMGKALREAYRGRKGATSRKMAFGFFMGLLAFSFFFMAQTMEESIFAETFPQVMQASFFSTLTLYIHLVPFLYALYLITYYDDLLFGEIRANRFYLLTKMDYSPSSLIGAKILALYLSAAFVYSLGFFLTLFLTFFLKYSLVTGYLPALFLAGLADLYLVLALALLISSVSRSKLTGRYLILLSLVPVYVLRGRTGFSSILANRALTQDLNNLFDPERSLYLYLVLAILLLSLVLAGLVARIQSSSCRLSKSRYNALLPPGEEVVRIHARTGKRRLLGDLRAKARQKKVLDGIITSFLILFILATLLFNAMVLIINASSRGRHVAIRGVIPYVFKTDTMAPEIKVNDLAFFDKYERDREVNVGDVILFDQDEVMFVERVIKIEGEVYTVDIDNYPPFPEHASMVKEVNEGEIAGIFRGRSRWLGALILFANTIFGRISFLLVPALLLFFQRSLAGWKPFRKEEEED